MHITPLPTPVRDPYETAFEFYTIFCQSILRASNNDMKRSVVVFLDFSLFFKLSIQFGSSVDDKVVIQYRENLALHISIYISIRKWFVELQL